MAAPSLALLAEKHRARMATNLKVAVRLAQAADPINSMTPVDLKIYENRLRRMAARQSLTLMKSRTRDQRATTYGGYMIVDQENNVVAGGHPSAYSLSIDGAERFLVDPKRPTRRKAAR